MEETKNSAHKTAYGPTDTFQQHYAGTFVAKRYEEYNEPIYQDTQPDDAEREPLPMEMKALADWIRDPKNHNAITAVCAVAGVIVASLYTLFAILQWCALRDSNETAVRQLRDSEAAQAAQLIIDDVKVIATEEPNGTVGGNLTGTLKNIGQTSAMHISGQRGVISGYIDSPEYTEPEPNPISPWSIPAGKSEPFSVTVATGWPKDPNQRMDPKTKLGLRGDTYTVNLSYYDIFGNPHWLAFCRNTGHLLEYEPCQIRNK